MSKGSAVLVKETITVAKSTQWGPVANDELFGLNEPLTATDFVPGKTYEVLIKKGTPTAKYPQGKKYISQIVGDGIIVSNNTPVLREALSPIVNKVLDEVSQTVSSGATAKVSYNRNYDEATNRRILRQGVFQASLNSPAIAGMAFTNVTEYVALVKDISEQVIRLIEG